MKHGGDISEALAQFGPKNGGWLDLSTGISPHAYPFTAPAQSDWQALPQRQALDRLLEAARETYRVPDHVDIVAAPGTQILIQLLPLVCKRVTSVRVFGPTYSEHALCWRRFVPDTQVVSTLTELSSANVAVLTNPNNPDGRIVSTATLNALPAEHGRGEALIVIDEAFADIVPEASAIPAMPSEGMLVLRSFGKFYGLAGLRLGFAIGPRSIISALDELLGQWAVSGPACTIGAEALANTQWAEAARERYADQSRELDAVLIAAGLDIIGGTTLFRLTSHPHASEIHQALASAGILVRKFDDHPTWLRFGLPESPEDLERLASALKSTTRGSARA